MKNTTQLTLAAVAVLFLSATGFSQKSLKKADELFDAHQYFNSINYYKDAYANAPKDKKPTILFKQGLASQYINDVKNAEETVQKLTDEFMLKIDAFLRKKEAEIMTV